MLCVLTLVNHINSDIRTSRKFCGTRPNHTAIFLNLKIKKYFTNFWTLNARVYHTFYDLRNTDYVYTCISTDVPNREP